MTSETGYVTSTPSSMQAGIIGRPKETKYAKREGYVHLLPTVGEHLIWEYGVVLVSTMATGE